jgi:hypothetical protein
MKRMPRLSYFLAFGLFFALLARTASATDAPVSQQQELEFLQQAAAGNTENVFFMRMFAGKIALPRTFTLARVRRSQYSATVGAEARKGHPRGYILFGKVEVVGDARRDADSHAPLPAASQASRRVGDIVVEDYTEGDFDLERSAFVSDGDDYLWFMGDAVPYVTDVLKAYASLTPAPIPEAGTGEPDNCVSRIIHGQPDYANGVLRGIKLFPRDSSAKSAFVRLGFRAGDLYKPGGSEPLTVDSWQAVILSARDGATSVSVQRNGNATAVTLTPSQIASVFGDCRVTIRDRF